jgi:hypothetical protein
VVWSGWLTDEFEAEAERFVHDPRLWQPAAWSMLIDRLRALAPIGVGTGQRLLIRPHARHIVSDIPACLKLAGQIVGTPGTTGVSGGLERFGLLMDWPGMLTPSMLASLDDHLERLLSGIQTLNQVYPHVVAGAILGDVERAGGEHEDLAGLRLAAWGRGLIGEAKLAMMEARLQDLGIAVIRRGEGAESGG